MNMIKASLEELMGTRAFTTPPAETSNFCTTVHSCVRMVLEYVTQIWSLHDSARGKVLRNAVEGVQRKLPKEYFTERTNQGGVTKPFFPSLLFKHWKFAVLYGFSHGVFHTCPTPHLAPPTFWMG